MRGGYARIKIIEYLNEKPFLSHACKKSGVARATVYRWMKDNAQFRKEVESSLDLGRKNMCDVAEASLFKKTADGDISAIKFVLQNNEPRYIAKRSIYVEPPKHVHKKLQPYEMCDQCGYVPISNEAKQSITRAFKNFGIIKDDDENIKNQLF